MYDVSIANLVNNGIQNLYMKVFRFLIERWHLSCHCKHTRVLCLVGTNMWNVKDAIVSQTVPRIVSKRQQVGELMIFGVKKCVAQRLAMINNHRCYTQKFASATETRAKR